MLNQAEYIWLDGAKPDPQLRSKTRVVEVPDGREADLGCFPRWSYDGSSTYQADGGDSDLLLEPVRFVQLLGYEMADERKGDRPPDLLMELVRVAATPELVGPSYPLAQALVHPSVQASLGVPELCLPRGYAVDLGSDRGCADRGAEDERRKCRRAARRAVPSLAV